MNLDAYLDPIARGDVGAFSAWVARAEAPLRDSLRSFAAAVDTEAVLQEALLRIWQVAPRVIADGQPNALLRFGVRVARNLAVSERRRLRADPAEPGVLEQHAIDLPTPDPWLRRRISDCQQKLPKKPGRALAERLANGGREPDEQLAARLSMRTNTFVQNVARARRFLAECLESQGVRLTPRCDGG